MPELSAAAMLDLWQAAEARDRIARPLVLAAAADGGETTADALARLPLGRRDARVLSLHAALGGGALEATASCPSCGEHAEFAIDAEGLDRGPDATPETPVEVDGFVVAWRSPDSRDLAAAAGAGGAAAAERVLLARCVTAATAPGGAEADAAALPRAVRETLARAMAAADPLAEVLVDVSCPGCGSAFVADVDIGEFVWTELRAHARRLLREVDVLARTYGWTEPDVLALDERRRAAYLELAAEARV